MTEHPAAPGMPYGQEGGQATIYQLVAQDGAKRTLKVFKPHYSFATLMTLADRIAPAADLLGSRACCGTVLTPQLCAATLRQRPDLAYVVLMSWVQGPKWIETLLEKTRRQPWNST